MKRVFALLLCMSLILCGCGTTVEETQPTTTAAPTTEPATLPETEPATLPATEPTTVPTTVPETEPPTEPPVVVTYRHPITGEILDAPLETRPVAVVTNNASVAQPVYGIGGADLLFEIMAEGGGSITRCVAIYTDLEAVNQIGSIRSARTYLIDLARSFWAVLVHCGGSNYADAELESSKYNSINQFYNGDYFFRDQKRLDAGYSWEHCLFTTGEKLLAAIEKRGFDMVNEGGSDYGYTFSENVELAGETANEITLSFHAHGKRTTMTYDAEKGVYFGMQKWKKDGEYKLFHSLSDGNTGEQVPIKNVLILYAKKTNAEDGVHIFHELTGDGEGYFACNGKIVPITWERDSLTDSFSYYLEDGTPVTLGVGKTYVGIIPLGSPVEYQ